MARPRKTLRPVSKNIHLPEDVVAAVELQLWSDLEARVPHGAWSRLLERLLRKHLAGPEKPCSGTQTERCRTDPCAICPNWRDVHAVGG